MVDQYTKAEELSKMPDLPLEHLSGYVNVPKGYVCKVANPHGTHLVYNPETKHVIVYSYHETRCYVDSASDVQYNGHYDQSMDFTAE